MQPATEADIHEVNAATAQVFGNLQQHPGFAGQFSRFVLITGSKGLHVETVSANINSFMVSWKEYGFQAVETTTTREFTPQFPDYLEASGFVLTDLPDDKE